MKLILTSIMLLLSSGVFAHGTNSNGTQNVDPKVYHKCGVYGSGNPFRVVNIGDPASVCVAPEVVAHTDSGSCLLSPAPANAQVFEVTAYGATANDSTVDSTAIQAAVLAADAYNNAVSPSRKSIVNVPAGTFLVNHGVIFLKSNITLRMQPTTVLKMVANNLQSFQAVRVQSAANVNIIGGTIQGDRSTHTGTGGEWGHGVTVDASTNVSIQDVKLIDSWGDGAYVGGNTVGFNMCKSSAVNNRRNGVSITSGSNMLVRNNSVHDNNGTSPHTGIDLEPNLGETLNNVKVAHNFIYNQKGYGISSGFSSPQSGYDSSGIELTYNYIKDVSYGIVLAHQNGTSLSKNRIENTKHEGVYVYKTTKLSDISENTILNAGQCSDGLVALFGSCTPDTSDGIGVYMEYASGMTITMNTITNSARAAIVYFLSDYVTTSQNVMNPNVTIPAGLQ